MLYQAFVRPLMASHIRLVVECSPPARRDDQGDEYADSGGAGRRGNSECPHTIYLGMYYGTDKRDIGSGMTERTNMVVVTALVTAIDAARLFGTSCTHAERN